MISGWRQKLSTAMFTDESNKFQIWQRCITTDLKSDLRVKGCFDKENKFSTKNPPNKRLQTPNILPKLFNENTSISRDHVTKFFGLFVDENKNLNKHIIGKNLLKSIDREATRYFK